MKNMLQTFTLALALACGVSASAQPQYNITGALGDFSAPVVSSTSAVSDKQVGMIIFDLSSNQYKGLNYSGTWDAMTPGSGNIVTSGASSDRVERARIAGASETTSCSSNPCTVTRESGDWISSVTWSSNGRYTINVNSGIFSSAPVCTTSVVAGGTGGRAFMMGSNATSGTSITITADNQADAATNVAWDIICVGPK